MLTLSFNSCLVMFTCMMFTCLFLQRLLKWEDRERRKEKEYEKDLKREKERRDDMVGVVHALLL